MGADLQTELLRTLDGQPDGAIKDTDTCMAGIDPMALRGVLSSLERREILSFTQIDRESWILSAEGKQLAASGSHEALYFNAVPEDGIELKLLQEKVGASFAFGQGKAFKNKWVKKDGTRIVRNTDSIVDQTKLDLEKIARDGLQLADAAAFKDLVKRKLVEKCKKFSFSVAKGPKFTLDVRQEEADITPEMLQSGNWKTATFKQYNFNAKGTPPDSGHLHPLLKVRSEFRQIFFELGFTEMPTNKFVESSFWNFDALFQPQQHPARDAHDTFFLKDPASTSTLPAEYLERVKKVHSVGDFGSIGYGYDWKREEAEKLILRTHTTAVSSYMLYKLAQQPGGFKPAKYFSIDRVFRNESVDATHLAEFHQIEGVIADRGITLGDLIGVLHGFFKKMGIERLRFKPAYNPYTEPSMEIFAWHNGLGKYVEIGNSGMFRPEMLLPLGLPPDVRVIAWGLGLERPTMIKYGINNIRDLLGHKVDLDMVKRNPIVRLDK
ncbi:MAG: hypothetical protein SGCHY_000872 [Lobulomycetales sp.]